MLVQGGKFFKFFKLIPNQTPMRHSPPILNLICGQGTKVKLVYTRICFGICLESHLCCKESAFREYSLVYFVVAFSIGPSQCVVQVVVKCFNN